MCLWHTAHCDECFVHHTGVDAMCAVKLDTVVLAGVWQLQDLAQPLFTTKYTPYIIRAVLFLAPSP